MAIRVHGIGHGICTFTQARYLSILVRCFTLLVFAFSATLNLHFITFVFIISQVALILFPRQYLDCFIMILDKYSFYIIHVGIHTASIEIYCTICFNVHLFCSGTKFTFSIFINFKTHPQVVFGQMNFMFTKILLHCDTFTFKVKYKV